MIYISDHGDWLGDHGLILKGPMHYEGLLRVPMIWRGPGVPAGARIDAPVSTLDLLPSFAELTGCAPLQVAHGTSLVPVWEGRATRDHAYNEWELLPTRTGVALSLRTVRTHRHKLTVDLRSGAGELYDLGADPHELDNLWDVPAAAAVQAELMARVMARPDDMRPVQVQVGMA